MPGCTLEEEGGDIFYVVASPVPVGFGSAILLRTGWRKMASSSFDQESRTAGNHIMLVEAIRKGSLAGVERWLERGASVHGVPAGRPNPLEFAANQGHVHIIEYLVERGAGLEQAARGGGLGGHGGVVIFGDTGRDILPPKGSRALHGACYGSRPEACHVLLELGADPNSVDIRGSTPLMIVCRFVEGQEKCLALAERLLRAGADPALQNCEGKIALQHAAGRGFTDVANILLSAAPGTLNHTDKRGNTALMHAAANGQGRTLSSLLAAGANDETAWKEGNSALLTAISVGQSDMVKLLLEEGLDAVGGKLAIPEAMRYAVQHEQIAILLLLLGVDGEANREIWATRPVWTGPVVLDLPPAESRGLQLWILAAGFGVPMVHCAAMFCSLRSVHVLLAAGADETALAHDGMCAKDCVGVKLPQDMVDPRAVAAVRRLLARGPAFRACSWTWPAAATSRRPKPPRLGVRVYRRATTNREGFSSQG